MVIDQILYLSSAIIKDKKGRILLIKRSGTKSYKGYWQLPEGKLEDGENPQDALKREIKEELGVEIRSMKLLKIAASPIEAKGIKYLACRAMFLTKILHQDFKLSTEHSEYRWFGPDAIKSAKLLPGTHQILEMN